MITGLSSTRIHVLPDDLVGRIAAGEVIERPAAVVKELVDNSLDAGSTSITVDVADGGLTRIAVSDNGEGMSPEDAVLAFQRHATSKLQSDADLWAISTLGFRGEALPSIAAVSHVQVVTMPLGAEVGTCVRVSGGAVQSVEDAAAAPGTRIEITDVFFNTPARKKFLKSATTEFGHILQVVQQASLAWPHVQFRLLHNGIEVVHCAAARSPRDRLLQIYRGTFLEHSLPVRRERPGIRIEGVTVGPVHVRASRTPQELFVNRRPVRNPTILHAIADAYGAHLAKGRHPQFVLFLDVDPTRVDVNVHPTKREVRFADKDYIHQAVRQAIRESLGVAEATALVSGASSGTAASVVVEREAAFCGSGSTASPWAVAESVQKLWASPADQLALDSQRTTASGDTPVGGAAGHAATAPVQPLGQLDRTFLVVQVGTELQIVDQHTAHERVLFERLWRSWKARGVQAQTLLVPVPLDLSAPQRAVLEPHLAEFEQVGLTIEPFGSETFLLRTVPALLGTVDGPALVHGLLEDLEEWHTQSSLDTRMQPVVATLACHSAVRAGRHMALPEIQRLVQDWVSEGMIMTCPHGRRVALRFPNDELARMFGRG